MNPLLRFHVFQTILDGRVKKWPVKNLYNVSYNHVIGCYFP